MNKSTNLFVCICIILGMVIGSAAAATPIEISIFEKVVGEGTIDRSILFQTDYGFEGQKFNADVYTPSLGRYGISFLNYTEESNMVLDNETTIVVIGSGTIINTKTAMAIKNYAMNTSMYHKIVGDCVLDYEYMADNNITAQYLVGKVDGRGDVSGLMRNSYDRTYIVRDRTQFDGKFKIEFEKEISCVEYPALKIGADWLGCP